MSSQLYLDEMPPQLRELAEVIGLPATLVLVEHYGGLPLDIPRTYHPRHALARLIGHRAAVALIQRYGGDRIYVAKAERAHRLIRDREIARRYDSGKSASKLAREFHLSERQVWNILKQPETLRDRDNGQLSLF